MLHIHPSQVGKFPTPAHAHAYQQANQLRSETEAFCADLFQHDNADGVDFHRDAGRLVLAGYASGVPYAQRGFVEGEATLDKDTGKPESLKMSAGNWSIQVKTSRGFLGLGAERTTITRRNESAFGVGRWQKATFYQNGECSYKERKL